MEIPPDDMEVCLRVLQQVASSNGTAVRSQRFNTLVSKVYREGRRHAEREERDRLLAQDRALLARTAMVRIQRDAVSAATLALPPPSFKSPPSPLSLEGRGAGVGSSSERHEETPLSPPASGRKSEGADARIEQADVPPRRLNQPESCYICHQDFTDVHFFYHLLCPKCAEYNYRMRGLTADLTGRTALITGGRVKIGFQTVLRLLRDGARVIVTTRFPIAAARRFHEEINSVAFREALEAGQDSGDCEDRLQIYGLDLRNIPAVEEFSRHLLQTESALDIIIHNAAQTIRRPRGFYRDLVEQEISPPTTLPAAARRLVLQGAPSTLAISDSSVLLPAVIPGMHETDAPNLPAVLDVLPADRLEDNEELADSRAVNSWLLRLDEVDAPEMLEVQLVNAIAPFLLNSRLKPLLLRSPFGRRFIVNVSAMEGQFSRHKTVFHPHTNMAKASLNMMTRTSAEDYAQDGIYMNSVDTGWVTDENPTGKRLRIQEVEGFFAPLDIIDGMARIYHPIAEGINNDERPLYGLFLKDYSPCRW